MNIACCSRERERALRRSETAEQREEWLRKRRVKDRARRVAATAEQRELALQWRKDRAAESREARLQHIRDRMATESTEEREASLSELRLQHIRNHVVDGGERQGYSWCVKTREKDLLRREFGKEHLHHSSSNRNSVQEKIRRFHAHFSSLHAPTCTTVSWWNLLFSMKALKCKTLGAEFATELLAGNGRRMNKSMIHIL